MKKLKSLYNNIILQQSDDIPQTIVNQIKDIFLTLAGWSKDILVRAYNAIKKILPGKFSKCLTIGYDVGRSEQFKTYMSNTGITNDTENKNERMLQAAEKFIEEKNTIKSQSKIYSEQILGPRGYGYSGGILGGWSLLPAMIIVVAIVALIIYLIYVIDKNNQPSALDKQKEKTAIEIEKLEREWMHKRVYQVNLNKLIASKSYNFR